MWSVTVKKVTKFCGKMLIVSTIWKAPCDIFRNVESANGIFEFVEMEAILSSEGSFVRRSGVPHF